MSHLPRTPIAESNGAHVSLVVWAAAPALLSAVLSVLPANAGASTCVDYGLEPEESLLGELGIAAPSDIHVRDDVVYLAIFDDEEGRTELATIDVLDPAVPVVLDVVDSPWAHGTLDVVGDVAYLAGPSLALFDVSDPAAIEALGFLDNVEFPQQNAATLDVADGLAYVLTETNALWIVDVSGDPSILSVFPIPSSSANHLVASGGYVYVVGIGGLFVVDATDPADPFLAAQMSLAHLGTWIDLVGGYAIVSVFTNPTAIIDVSNPAAPVFVGNGPGLAQFAVAGDLVYAPVGQYLTVIDWSDPVSPHEIGRLLGVLAFGVSVDDCHAATFNPFLPAELRMFPAHDDGIVGVDSSSDIAGRTSVYGVPNPFRTHSFLTFESGAEGTIRVEIHDAAGRLVRRIFATAPSVGLGGGVSWDGRDDEGRALAAGSYFYRVDGAGRGSGRVTLMK